MGTHVAVPSPTTKRGACDNLSIVILIARKYNVGMETRGKTSRSDLLTLASSRVNVVSFSVVGVIHNQCWNHEIKESVN